MNKKWGPCAPIFILFNFFIVRLVQNKPDRNTGQRKKSGHLIKFAAVQRGPRDIGQ